MKMDETIKIDELINLPQSLGLPGFDEFIVEYLKRKSDKKLALKELDTIIGILQNHVLLLSLHLKQNYLIEKPTDNIFKSVDYFTKHEIAVMYRVSIRTVNNWIRDGLKSTEIGGVIRIGKEAILEFTKKNKTKKFNWRSVVKNIEPRI